MSKLSVLKRNISLTLMGDALLQSLAELRWKWFFFIKCDGSYKKKKNFCKYSNIPLLCRGAVWLLGSKPAVYLFHYCKDPETWRRKSWSASKHLASLKGMKDTLLRKLGSESQTVQITLLGFTGKYSVHYHWATFSIQKQITFHCSALNEKLQCIVFRAAHS